ncbi:MAG: hypothetical protein HGN29_07860 [Asgard group archaeon]|nr:hypothetical protein [Asgard group archaeon]
MESDSKKPDDEQRIRSLLYKIQKGYTDRDENVVSEWAEDLFDERVTIIGTSSIKPGDFEWRNGHAAAIEMFRSDWLNWGDVKLSTEEAEIDIEGNASWVAVYATVTRDTKKSVNHSAEVSRERSLKRIKQYSEKEWTTKQALYEIIYDASMVLTQYERSDIFIWPIRITLGLFQRNNKWLIRQVHFSFPGRGFPNVRLE